MSSMFGTTRFVDAILIHKNGSWLCRASLVKHNINSTFSTKELEVHEIDAENGRFSIQVPECVSDLLSLVYPMQLKIGMRYDYTLIINQ